MLSHNTPSKPRPTPPAKLRRATQTQQTRTPSQPPPPYAPRMDMILDSPVSVTAQLVDVGSRRSPGLTGPPVVDGWMTEKSRKELSNLLVVAGDIIKSRETELGLTSSLCKNLYEENVTLKTRHDALLSRIPGRDASPLPSPTRSLSPLPLPPNSPHYYSGSRPVSPSPLSDSPPQSQIHARHTRRISVTPAELSLLADQNAELLDKLGKLEEESAHADLAGKRKLRKLEKEIAGLRSELDKTREKGEELEQNLKKRGIGLTLEEEEVAKRKKEEREERLRALKEKTVQPTPVSDLQEVKDFAPASELPRVRTVSNPKAPALNLATKPLPHATTPVPEEGIHPMSAPASVSALTSYFPASASATSIASVDALPTSPPQLEHAIIAQLLAKIRELEETNVQIAQGQKIAAERMQAAQRDAENIKRAYDVLDEGSDELEIITEDADHEVSPSEAASPTPRSRVPTGSTVRFSSLRRTIECDVSTLALMEDPREEFASGITKQSTTRSTIDLGSPVQQHKGKVAGQKTRKSVVGLFDVNTPTKGGGAAATGRYPTVLSVSPDFRMLSPIPFPPGMADISTWSTAATDGLDEPSSPASSHSNSPSPSVYSSPLLTLTASNLELVPGTSSLGLSSGQARMHTLGSELGSDFGDDWGERAGNHHLRATSLYDISAMWSRDASGPATGSDSPVVGPEIILPTPSSSPPSDSVWEDVDESPPPPAPSSRTSDTEILTPTKSRFPTNGLQLQLVIEPPTPSPNKHVRPSPSSVSLRSSPLGLSASTSSLSLRESRSSRNLRLSQTVKARTNRWVERVEKRYAEPQPSVVDTSSQAVMRRRRSVTSLQKRQRRTSTALDDTFEQVVHQVSRSFSGSTVDIRNLPEEDEVLNHGKMEAVVLAANEQKVIGAEAKKKRDGFVGFILEVWLWMQFAIVVCVFLWAMARRGPKSVLEDADRRRVQVQRR